MYLCILLLHLRHAGTGLGALCVDITSDVSVKPLIILRRSSSEVLLSQEQVFVQSYLDLLGLFHGVVRSRGL
jgi:hypothetical protein